MAFRQDLALYQGDDWAATVTVLNCDRTPADLTGYTAQSQIREGIADQTWEVAAQLTCAVVPPDQISISLTSLQTTLLVQPVYQWDLQITSPGGIVTTILAGEVQMVFEVTRLDVAQQARKVLWRDQIQAARQSGGLQASLERQLEEERR